LSGSTWQDIKSKVEPGREAVGDDLYSTLNAFSVQTATQS
jgi:hypothetical protein